MKAWLFATAIVLAAGAALVPAARAEGPRPSSEHNWPGMSYPVPEAAYAAPASDTRYVWEDGYERGKWHGHWVLAR